MGTISEVQIPAINAADPLAEEQTTGKSGAMKCPKCSRNTMSRTPRRGLWRRFIAPIFGYYPWRCGVCKKVKLLKKRGVHRRKHSQPLPQ